MHVQKITGFSDDVSISRICITICTRLRGFKVRYMIEEINCRSWSSSVFSCGPVISHLRAIVDLWILRQVESIYLLLFLRLIHLFAGLRQGRLWKREPLLPLSWASVIKQKLQPVVQRADPSARDSGFVERLSEISILSPNHRGMKRNSRFLTVKRASKQFPAKIVQLLTWQEH